MPKKIFEKIAQELKKGVFTKGHYFKYFTLATLGVDKFARLRLVALRNVSDDLKLTFFTDKRSKKMLHIKENNKVSLLFYDHEKLIQLRIEGIARINNDQFQIQKSWEQVGVEARKDYITKEAPGSTIGDPGSLEYLREGDYFSIVEIDPFRIEYLELKENRHTKIRYSKEGSGDWTSEYLVP